MSNFTKNIQTQKGLITFYFNRIYTVNGVKYHVSVRDNKTSYYFMMEGSDEQWNFLDDTPLPHWIIELEKELKNAINAHLKDG
jgi:hypothetical protein